MVTVHNKYRRRFSAIGGIDEHPAVPCLLNESLDGGRIRAYHGDEPPGGNEIAESDVYQLHRTLPYSMFCTCSRIFSTSAFMFTTSCVMVRSLHLEPMVLHSRLIS